MLETVEQRERTPLPQTMGRVVNLAKTGSIVQSSSAYLLVDPVIAAIPGLFGGNGRPIQSSDLGRSADLRRTGGTRPDQASAMKTAMTGNLADMSRSAMIQLMKSPQNWDGEGAKAITQAACEAAMYLDQTIEARSYRPPSSIAPSTTGAIGFTWKGKTGLINVQVTGLGKQDCVINWSRAGGRTPMRCSILEAIVELGSFLALD